MNIDLGGGPVAYLHSYMTRPHPSLIEGRLRRMAGPAQRAEIGRVQPPRRVDGDRHDMIDVVRRRRGTAGLAVGADRMLP